MLKAKNRKNWRLGKREEVIKPFKNRLAKMLMSHVYKENRGQNKEWIRKNSDYSKWWNWDPKHF